MPSNFPVFAGKRAISAVAALLLCFAPLARAQSAQLITQPLNDAVRVSLQNKPAPFASAQNDRGAVSDSESTGTLFMVLGRSAASQANLDNYVKSAAMPGSANFQNWLTPAAYGKLYGANSTDVAAVKSWLESYGFTVGQVSPAGNVISFSGNIGDVRQAFQTEIHSFQVGSNTVWANASSPTVPAALAPAVRGVTLSGLRPAAMHVLAGAASSQSSVSATSNQPKPNLTIYGPSTWSAANYDVYFLPGAGDAATMYDSPNSAMNTAYSGTTWNGSGVTIGIVGDSNLSASAITDIARYRSLFLNETLTAAKADAQMPKIVLAGDDPGENSDELEALIDVEQAMALAPKANTTFYTANSTDLVWGGWLAIQRAVDDNTVSILNISFGSCEENFGAGYNVLLNELFEQAAAQGMSVTVSSGDSGSAGCDDDSYPAVNGLAVNGIASTPWNIAVGGTDFDVLFSTSLSTVEQYIKVPTTTATITGTGAYMVTAKGYIPEEPWNDSTQVFTTAADNVQFTAAYDGTTLYAGGGGMSSAAVCSGNISSSGTCSGTLAGYAKPAFQSSITPADGVRDLPDVSFFAGAFMGNEGTTQDFNNAWSFCADSTVTGSSLAYTDCQTVAGSQGCNGTCAISINTTTTPVGGTSTSAPLMASVLALVSQSQGGKRLGQADYVLYNLAASEPAVFHDITQGNNSVDCTAGTPNCASNDFLTGYDAGPGYDLATGIGSIDVAKLVTAWSTATFTATTTTLKGGTSAGSLSTSPLTVAHGATLYFQVGVSPTAATGAISLITNSSQVNSDSVYTAQLVNGVATFNTEALPGGTYTVYADYGGDTTHAASSSNGIQVTVASQTSAMSVSVSAYSAQTGALLSSPVYGSIFWVDATPSGSSEGTATGTPATGTAAITLDGTSLTTVSLNSQGVAAYQIPSVTLTAGTHTIKVAYSGDASYGAVSMSQTVTVAQAPPLLVATPPSEGQGAPTALSIDNPMVSGGGAALSYDTYSAGAAPTGTIIYMLNGAAWTTQTVTASNDYDEPTYHLWTMLEGGVALPITAFVAGTTGTIGGNL